nr:MAG TPA: hypothetical protein [Caudoviricetes sp.]
MRHIYFISTFSYFESHYTIPLSVHHVELAV